MFLSRSQYATHRGCAAFAVDRAIQSGRIRPEPDGTIDPEKADRDWDANTDALRSRILTHSPSRGAGVQQDGNRQPITIEFLRERTAREREQVKLKRLEYQVKSGELVPRKEIEAAKRAVLDRVLALRGALLDLPDRLAAELAGDREQQPRIREAIERELRIVLERFAAAPAKPEGEAAA